MNWKDSVTTIRWNVRPFIDGRYRSSNSTEFFNNINPATETTLCQIAVGDSSDIDEAVRVARKRFNDGCWSELQPMHRVKVLLRLADLIVQHKAEFALLDTMEMGKPIQASLYDADTFAPALLRSCAGFADKLLGVSAPLGGGTVSFNTYEPRGVVGAITPWNFPCVNAVIKFAPALAAGNTVVLKPSEVAASSALRLAELALEAGLPEGVLNVVPGLGSTVGEALALHRDVDLISFTGSTVTGRKILELSGRSNAKPMLLECGGKSPQVVFGDVDNLDYVAEAVVQSILWNQGQVCSAHTRLIVREEIKEALLEKIIRRATGYLPSDPLDETTAFGPLASPGQRDRVKAYIEQGLKAGAEAVLKGTIKECGGCYVSPTIFDRVDAQMSIVQEEIFGPVLCVQDFKTEEEAIALANGTDYGLAATVWTRDMGRGKRLAHAIKAGHVSIRTSGHEEADQGYLLSHEPQKASGFGSELGQRGLQSYSTLKLISFRGA
ncbi:MAG TPA: aldehyde dehydrogenase family protein [Steroidobacteraceae bacterium]|jgi:acyl-CoA reductase-like NAD-dependent aldehyde dehydrogenase